MNTKFKHWLEQQTYAQIEMYDVFKRKWDTQWMLHSIKKKIYKQKHKTTHQILKFKWGEVVNKNL
jgi:hypothetical protein